MADSTEERDEEIQEYTQDEVLAASLEYFNGDQLAASTFQSKYALRHQVNGEDKYRELTPDGMHDRLAKEFARTELKYPNPISEAEIRGYFDHFNTIVPQGSPMYGIGNPFVNVSLSNCVVVKAPNDSITDIFETGKHLANLYKNRCGVGVSIDQLRPKGTVVNNAAGSSTGSVSFAGHYSNITRLIGQSGRRGALMVTISILHPDIVEFATVKRDVTQLTGANISIMLGDEFMNAVQENKEWICRWPIDTSVDDIIGQGGIWQDDSITGIQTTIRDKHYEDFMDHINSSIWISSNKSEKRVLRKFQAKDLWRLINESAVACAEPGLLFWDNYCNNMPAHCYENFRCVSTNPCAELALGNYDSCRLLTVNLKWFVKDPFTVNAKFETDKFNRAVYVAQRLMDDLVDLEIEHLQRIIDKIQDAEEKWLWIQLQRTAIEGRRTGLGTHGLADCLARLELRYDSDEAISVIDDIYRQFSHAAYQSSVDMSKERGSFPVFDWDREKDNAYIKRLPQSLQDDIQKYGRRNISLLTLAPTGSVSIESQTSSGLEPSFLNYYMRRKKVNPSDRNVRVDFVDQSGDSWTHFEVYHKNVQDWFDFNLDKKSEWERIKSIADPEHWSKEISQLLPDYFVVAPDIDAMKRVKVQSVITQHLDHGSSSTVNLPEGTKTATVQGIYEEAWRLGLKGVTVYVDGSRSGVLVKAKDLSQIQDSQAPKRPESLDADIVRSNIGSQEWIILVGKLNGRPYEVFGGLSESVKIPKKITSGRIVKRKCEKINAKGRLSCYDLVVGGGEDEWTIKDIAVQFNDGNYAWATRVISLQLRHGVPIHYIIEQMGRDIDSNFFSFNKVMARILKRYVKDGTASGAKCESCGEKLTFSEGCSVCLSCGNSKCG